MTVHDGFFAYLEHFGDTVQIRTLHGSPEVKGLCGLRHDVDHSIDVALEVAHYEYRRGVSATYFLLPTASYWTDPYLVDKCLQLQDYGHEVGLHMNVLAEWFSGDIDDPAGALHRHIDLLRNGGVDISGLSSHGDKRCYSDSFINYWLFADLKPKNPVLEESGRTAEGLLSQDSRYSITYPECHTLTRQDGAEVDLWSLQMEDFGIEYDAWHVRHDEYFSDSGGGWRRTQDPLEVERGNGRWQVLMHPIHWRGNKKRYFFLSPARSGSTWVTDVLNHATPIEARHEFVLNQDFFAGKTGHKNTSTFGSLQQNPEVVKELLLDAWQEIEGISGDYAEANVYLASFLDELKTFFPDAIFVHLKRNPQEVVRSLMNRNWFETVPDSLHPVVWEEKAAPSTQFERVCHYVRATQSRLDRNVDVVLDFDRLSSSVDSLVAEMHTAGIPVHPRLAERLIGKVVNANTESAFPVALQWSADIREAFDSIFGEKELAEPVQPAELERTPVTVDFSRVKTKNFLVERNGESLSVGVVSLATHSYLTLGGSEWSSRRTEPSESGLGWKSPTGSYLAGSMSGELRERGGVAIYGLSFNDGGLLSAKKIGALTKQLNKIEFSFAPHPLASSADVALYVPAGEPVGTFTFDILTIFFFRRVSS